MGAVPGRGWHWDLLPSPGVGVEEGYLKNSIYFENAYVFLGRLPGCQPPHPHPHAPERHRPPEHLGGGVGAGLRTARLGCSALPCPALSLPTVRAPWSCRVRQQGLTEGQGAVDPSSESPAPV